MKKIALEEHFMAPGFENYEADVEKMMDARAYKEFALRLPEFADLRLQAMNNAEIEMCVLSQTSPGLQTEKDTATAIRKSQEANDFLAQQIQKHPSRFAGFAHLAMQDPTAAAKELKRCIEDLGFKGALVNGHTNGVYLDDQRYIPFWETLNNLDVPLYLHPADSFDKPHMYEDHPDLMGPTWGWTVETTTHALRLIVSGLFDRLPKLKVILGHMGEALPFMLWRFDSRWQIGKHSKKLEKPLSQYVKDNIIITTSGVCDNAPLLCSIEALGADNILFSTDYPFESTQIAADFIDKAPLSEDVRKRICYQNAQRILKLG
ncbi:MAG: amidohydrolase [Cyanobacteria bacterium SZAS-4]|nr:amidohydrolase [Cyanobacteria bacterium SZAS-4]